MNLEMLIERVGLAKFEDLCAKAHADSEAEFNRKPVKKGFDPWVPHDLSDLVWESELPCRDKLSLIQRLYEAMPAYTYIASISMAYDDLEEKERSQFWEWTRSTLASEVPSLIWPLGYSLWCDFFEDSNHVERAWRELTSLGLPESVIQLALESSGPVPYELKSTLYERLIPEGRWHPYIFKSLLFSSTEYFGDLDKKRARQVLRNLKLSPGTEHLGELKSRIQRWWWPILVF